MSPAVLVNVVGFFLGAVLYGMLLAMALGAGVPAATATEAWAARWRSPASRLMILTGLLGLLWNLGALIAYGFSPTLRDADLRVPLVIAFSALGFLPAVVVHSVLTRRSQLPASRAERLTFATAYALSSVAAIMHLRAALLGLPVPSVAALTLLTAGFVILILALLITAPRRGQDAPGYDDRWHAGRELAAVADDDRVVADRLHPHVQVLRGIDAGGEGVEEGHIEVLVVEPRRADEGLGIGIAGGGRVVLVDDQARGEAAVVAPVEVEVTAAVDELVAVGAELVEGLFLVGLGPVVGEDVVVGAGAVVLVVDDGAAVALINEPRAVVAHPACIRSTANRFRLGDPARRRGTMKTPFGPGHLWRLFLRRHLTRAACVACAQQFTERRGRLPSGCGHISDGRRGCRLASKSRAACLRC